LSRFSDDGSCVLIDNGNGLLSVSLEPIIQRWSSVREQSAHNATDLLVVPSKSKKLCGPRVLAASSISSTFLSADCQQHLTCAVLTCDGDLLAFDRAWLQHEALPTVLEQASNNEAQNVAQHLQSLDQLATRSSKLDCIFIFRNFCVVYF